MFKRDFKVMFMTSANQFIDPNVYWSTILRFLKNVSVKKQTHFQQYSKKCNNLMNDSCFKAKTEFDKVEQEFVKFPDNMCSQIIFMNIQKTVQDNTSPIINSLYGILMELLQNC